MNFVRTRLISFYLKSFYDQGFTFPKFMDRLWTNVSLKYVETFLVVLGALPNSDLDLDPTSLTRSSEFCTGHLISSISFQFNVVSQLLVGTAFSSK